MGKGTNVMRGIYENLAKEGSIVPTPLVMLAVAIAFPTVVMGCLVERSIRRMFGKKDAKG
jgi:hypothetical protein